ncbi:unnamed protein product, partial [Ilex paraguariensis]
GSKGSIQVIKNALTKLELLAGLNPNLLNSTAYFAGVNDIQTLDSASYNYNAENRRL